MQLTDRALEGAKEFHQSQLVHQSQGSNQRQSLRQNQGVWHQSHSPSPSEIQDTHSSCERRHILHSITRIPATIPWAFPSHGDFPKNRFPLPRGQRYFNLQGQFPNQGGNSEVLPHKGSPTTTGSSIPARQTEAFQFPGLSTFLADKRSSTSRRGFHQGQKKFRASKFKLPNFLRHCPCPKLKHSLDFPQPFPGRHSQGSREHGHYTLPKRQNIQQVLKARQVALSSHSRFSSHERKGEKEIARKERTLHSS